MRWRNSEQKCAAARALGLELRVLKADTEGEIEAAFTTFGKLQTGALDVMPDPFFDSRRELSV